MRCARPGRARHIRSAARRAGMRRDAEGHNREIVIDAVTEACEQIDELLHHLDRSPANGATLVQP
jgi:hypothetical protein